MPTGLFSASRSPREFSVANFIDAATMKHDGSVFMLVASDGRGMTEQKNSYLFVREMVASGHFPLEIVKALRQHFGYSLEEAYPLVVTPEEIHIFMDANKRRGVSQPGATRLLRKIYGLSREKAENYVELSGNWSDDANFLSIDFEFTDDEGELDMKGWRADITVRANGKTFKPTFYHPLRIRQDVERWEKSKDWNFVEELVVLQENLLNDAIRKRIRSLFEAGYFR